MASFLDQFLSNRQGPIQMGQTPMTNMAPNIMSAGQSPYANQQISPVHMPNLPTIQSSVPQQQAQQAQQMQGLQSLLKTQQAQKPAATGMAPITQDQAQSGWTSDNVPPSQAAMSDQQLWNAPNPPSPMQQQKPASQSMLGGAANWMTNGFTDNTAGTGFGGLLSSFGDMF